MGQVQSRPVGSGPSSRTKNTIPMGDHWHINNGTHQLPHIWPFIFTPTLAPNPLFYNNCHPKSYFFPHPVQNFCKFFTQRPLIVWNFRKRYPNAPYFMAFVTERPLFFCLACTCLFEGNVAPSNTSQNLENSVFSKQNRAIWWILSGAEKRWWK